jgi:hypothetical protein
MGYMFKGVCYGDAPAALDAFRDEFPQLQGTTMVNMTTNTTTATGLITYVTTTKVLNSATTTTNASATIQLGTCTEEMVHQFSLQDFLLPFLIVLFWAIGFNSGLKR